LIALLIMVLLPAIRIAGPPALRAQCVNNLKQIAVALYNYEQEYKVLPPTYTVDAQGRPLHSWRTLILPYLEELSLYETIDLSKPWNDPSNAKALQTYVPVFHCPAAVGPRNTTTYLTIGGPNGGLLPNAFRRREEIANGGKSKLLVIEAGEENAVAWMAPVDAAGSLVMRLGPTSKLHHARGTNACSDNGSVMFMKADTPAKARRAWMSISGRGDERGGQ
jgi:hypothetical protein